MKHAQRIIPLLLMMAIWQYSSGQAGEWTWTNGSSVLNASGVYGTQGVPSPTVTPPSVYEGAQWTDTAGFLWLYGGQAPTGISFYSDLWRFDPSTNEWTWVKGPGGQFSQPPVYGTKNVASPNNTPGGRGWAPATWTDENNRLFLFGGANYTVSDINDFWMYDIPTNQWTWIGGSNTPGNPGTFGTQGVPSVNNVPGARHEGACAWNGANNTLWLFGGYRNIGEGNDLWRYDVATAEWTWMKGSQATNQLPVWGTKYFPASTNDPGGRNVYTRWADKFWNLYLLGGLSNQGNNPIYNDVWLYSPATSDWTWIGGDTIPFAAGMYQSACDPDFFKLPRARSENRSCWQDNCNNMWTFGGLTAVGGVGLNDFWHFNTSNYEWTFINGDTTTFNTFFYGIKNVSAPTNKPPAKIGAMSWVDKQHNLWMFGGTNTNFQHRNDMWRFVIDTTCIHTATDCTPQNAAPVVAFYSSDTILCEKSAIDFFDISSGNPTQWQWYFPGASPDTSTMQNPQGIFFPAYGTYAVTLVAYNVFGQDSLTITSFITVVANPPKPPITFNGQQMCTDPAVAYQWYFNNQPILAGGNTMCYTPPQWGNYYVIITDSNGCNSSSDVFVVNGVHDVQINSGGFALYPNPASEVINITASKPTSGELNISVYDSRMRFLTSFVWALESSDEYKIDCSIFAEGMYFIFLQSEQFTQMMRVSITRP